ncbi:hypothetical protein HHL21_05775 [Massilia sp. RP-1-19]|uniref:Fibronectin type-III domain-containing protein n=1 Tax=Massilia polaris TaxID=2728846 RepID=A0A848HGN5_9BURK|nr:hypothetical protein [Massilia polaris]NML60605.1 hypothetical protein [Massilia polaris]
MRAPPAVLPPSGLAVGTRTASSIALSWSAASGATGYNVYRNGVKVNASPVAATADTDTASTRTRWRRLRPGIT